MPPHSYAQSERDLTSDESSYAVYIWKPPIQQIGRVPLLPFCKMENRVFIPQNGRHSVEWSIPRLPYT
eukprot:857979-Pleurochrysis_carterae.AAC.1